MIFSDLDPMQNCCVETPGKIIRHKHSGNSDFPAVYAPDFPRCIILVSLFFTLFLRATLLWWVQKLLLALCVVQGIALGV
jgi:hypothetical protein